MLLGLFILNFRCLNILDAGLLSDILKRFPFILLPLVFDKKKLNFSIAFSFHVLHRKNDPLSPGLEVMVLAFVFISMILSELPFILK